MREPKVSILLNNYNYADYISQAIESALAQTYKNIEIIVVDDGSTDTSRSIIEAFGSNIQHIFKDNGGQASAFNAGFLASTGDLILFLDSDDYLSENCVEKVVKEWNKSYTKIHWRMSVVDRHGIAFGSYPPQSVKLDDGDLTRKLMSTAAYTCSPTSGNMFSKGFLELVMPIPEDSYRISADGFLLIHAALYGEIGKIEEELTSYRVHGNNAWAMEAIDIKKFDKYIKHGKQKIAIVGQYCLVTNNLKFFHGEEYNVLHNIYTLAYGKLSGIAFTDTLYNLAKYFRAVLNSNEISTKSGIKMLIWMTISVLLPNKLSKSAISWLFSPSSRPWIRKNLQRSFRTTT